MLPTDFPVHEAFDLSASMDPAKEVGGDFYDFFFLDEDHLALVIADVSGKGIPASLFMMVSMDMIKNYTKTGIPLTEVLSLTNRNLLENKDSEMFVTVWLGIYEIPTGHVRAVNAGHEYPMIRPAGGSFTMMRDKHCFVVGGLDTAVFTEYEFDVEVGGTLFLYTDGAPEATNISEEILGTDGVLAALNNDPDASPEDLIRNVTEAIDAFAGEAPQFDDQTMLVLHRKK